MKLPLIIHMAGAFASQLSSEPPRAAGQLAASTVAGPNVDAPMHEPETSSYPEPTQHEMALIVTNKLAGFTATVQTAQSNVTYFYGAPQGPNYALPDGCNAPGNFTRVSKFPESPASGPEKLNCTTGDGNYTMKDMTVFAAGNKTYYVEALRGMAGGPVNPVPTCEFPEAQAAKKPEAVQSFNFDTVVVPCADGRTDAPTPTPGLSTEAQAGIGAAVAFITGVAAVAGGIKLKNECSKQGEPRPVEMAQPQQV